MSQQLHSSTDLPRKRITDLYRIYKQSAKSRKKDRQKKGGNRGPEKPRAAVVHLFCKKKLFRYDPTGIFQHHKVYSSRMLADIKRHFVSSDSRHILLADNPAS